MLQPTELQLMCRGHSRGHITIYLLHYFRTSWEQRVPILSHTSELIMWDNLWPNNFRQTDTLFRYIKLQQQRLWKCEWSNIKPLTFTIDIWIIIILIIIMQLIHNCSQVAEQKWPLSTQNAQCEDWNYTDWKGICTFWPPLLTPRKYFRQKLLFMADYLEA